jgi:hypothetical protein
MTKASAIALLVTSLLGMKASALPVTTVQRDPTGRWLIHRDGEPVEMRGVCIWGTSPELSQQLERLRDIGGNVVRTYDDEHAGWTLDQCRRLGLFAWLTFDLGKPRHGFDYLDQAAVEAQRDRYDRFVLAHRHDPALIVWSIGNEAELQVEDPAQREALFREIAYLAVRTKHLDPTRPVSVTLAGFDDRLRAEATRWLGEIDVLGINVYAHATRLTELLDERGWTGPVAVTEYGPIGHWEAPKTPWDQPIEPTSAEKADHYARSWHAMHTEARSVGGFAFYWGWKQEVTETWFGMFLPDGSTLESIEALRQAWLPDAMPNTYPRLSTPRSSSGETFGAGETVGFEVELTGSARLEWRLAPESSVRLIGGDGEPTVAMSTEGVTRRSETEIDLRLPESPGAYRLFVTARSDDGRAATANLPILVLPSPIRP